MKKITLFLLLIFANISFAQKALNDYQYAIIPTKFSFIKGNNQFRVNLTTKAYFKQKGFVAFFDNEVLPEEVANNKCKSVYVNVEANNGTFVTRLKVVVRDCQQNVLFTSAEGTSREKNFSLAYDEALRAALKSMDAVDYKYVPGKVETIDEKATDKAYVPEAPAEEKTKKGDSEMPFMLLAEKNETGYLIKDMQSPKNIVMVLLKTSVPTVFIVQSTYRNGVVIVKPTGNYLEYYENGHLVSDELKIKL